MDRLWIHPLSKLTLTYDTCLYVGPVRIWILSSFSESMTPSQGLILNWLSQDCFQLNSMTRTCQAALNRKCLKKNCQAVICWSRLSTGRRFPDILTTLDLLINRCYIAQCSLKDVYYCAQKADDAVGECIHYLVLLLTATQAPFSSWVPFWNFSSPVPWELRVDQDSGRGRKRKSKGKD
jgi:hypothetical protein